MSATFVTDTQFQAVNKFYESVHDAIYALWETENAAILSSESGAEADRHYNEAMLLSNVILLLDNTYAKACV